MAKNRSQNYFYNGSRKFPPGLRLMVMHTFTYGQPQKPFEYVGLSGTFYRNEPGGGKCINFTVKTIIDWDL